MHASLQLQPHHNVCMALFIINTIFLTQTKIGGGRVQVVPSPRLGLGRMNGNDFNLIDMIGMCRMYNCGGTRSTQSMCHSMVYQIIVLSSQQGVNNSLVIGCCAQRWGTSLPVSVHPSPTPSPQPPSKV